MAPLKHQAFRETLDLSGLSMPEATLRFARMLRRLTQDWR